MRPFGCSITILNTRDHLGKLDGNADEAFFVGYSTNSKAFRVFNSRTRIVEENLHVKFSKATPNIAGSGPNWLFDIDAPTKSMNYEPVVVGNQSNGSADLSISSSSKDSHDVGFKPSEEEEKKDAKDPENKDKNNVTDENTVYGCDDDPNMPNLEEIVYSNDDEGVDAKADMTNLDTNIVVTENSTIQDFQNVVCMFLITSRAQKGIRKMKEAIVSRTTSVGVSLSCLLMTHGVCEDQFPDRVYKVEKALYGLHQAHSAWYETLSTYLLDNRFQRGQIDKSLFIKRVKELKVTQKDDGIFISQDKYVDEILKKFGFSTVKTVSTPMNTSNPLLKDAEAKDVVVHLYRSMIGSLMYLTASRPDIIFVQTIVANSTTEAEYVAASSCCGEMSSIGELTFFLGLQVTQKADGIFISQDKYVDKILKKLSFSTVKTVSTPMETLNPLLIDTEAKDVSSGPIPFVADETVINEWEDRIERDATTASSLEAEQDSEAGEKGVRSSKPRRLYKVGLSRRIKSTDNASLGAQEDASKKGRKIVDLDADIEVTLIDETQGRNDEDLMFDAGVLNSDEVFQEPIVNTDTTTKSSIPVSAADPVTTTGEVVTTASVEILEELTLAQTLIEIKSAKPKAVTTTIVKLASSRPKANGKLIDKHVEAKGDDDQEEAEMNKHMEIVQDDEVEIDVIPLATKPPVIVEWKTIKEGKMGYFQLKKSDGSSKRYSSIIQMLKNIDREDLETLWKLVKAKHGNKRQEEAYERVL
ncbi:putative ribonuclease H-like domain-containing protein [Tanacetum coccineum]|uniref:Ribonuclease H-like domain-containing protein n=1 Tax=Tanacetum coccineum TaxID=301880 RepID=A0ABQ4ZBA3_9ASTR